MQRLVFLHLLAWCALVYTGAHAYAAADPLRPVPAQVQALQASADSVEQRIAQARLLAQSTRQDVVVHAHILLAQLQNRNETIAQAMLGMASAVDTARRAEAPELLLSALEAQAFLFIERIQFADAHRALDELQTLAARRGLPVWQARERALRGAAKRREGDYAEALRLHQQALELRERSEDRFGQVESLNAMATLLRRGGELYQALDGHTKALRIARELGEQREIAESLSRISRIYAELDDVEPAYAFIQQALDALDKTAVLERAELLIDLAALQASKREFDAAQASTDEALSLARREQSEWLIAAGYLRQARILGLRGKPEQALVWIERSLELGKPFDGARSVVSKRLARLNLLHDLKRWQEAVSDAQLLLAETRSMGDRLLERDVLEVQSRVLFGAGDATGAYLAIATFSSLNQSLATTLTSRRIADLESSIKRRTLEADLALLARERDLQLLRDERQEWTVIGMAALGLALFGGLLALRTRVRAARTMNSVLVAQAEQLRRVAQTDALTGLTNRHGAQPILESLSGSAGACMILIDLDHFKRVNDQYGHPAGDAVLREVALRLSRACPANWTLARWGGEEFLLLGRVPEPAQAAEHAEALRQAVAYSPIQIDAGLALQITASVGVSVQVRDTPRAWDEQLQRADQALYQVKSSGRDQVQVALLD